MGKTLGIDMGPNSIGWAIIENKSAESGAIVDAGVRVFQVGVENYGQGIGKEQSKNAARRDNRLLRRGHFRKRLRKVKLLELLIHFDMCPLTTQQLAQWTTWDREKKSQGLVSPFNLEHGQTKEAKETKEKNEKIKQWLALNPWKLRAKAVTQDITLHEFGRILYHFVLRRGFLSSKKDITTGNTKTLAEGKSTDQTLIEGYDQIETQLKAHTKNNAETNKVTMGSILWEHMPKFIKKNKQLYDDGKFANRARARYTKRAFYVHELLTIWDRQAKHLGLDKESTTYDRTHISRYILTKPNTAKNNSNKSDRLDTETKKLRKNLKRISRLQLKRKLKYLYDTIHSTERCSARITVNDKEYELKRDTTPFDSLEAFVQKHIAPHAPTIIKIHLAHTQSLQYALLGEVSRLAHTDYTYEDVITHLNPPSLRKTVLYWQRDLKPQKYLKQKCTLEPSKPVIPLSHPLNEIRRIYEYINAIRIDGKALFDLDGPPHSDGAQEQYRTVRDFLLTQNNKKKNITFSELIKKCNLYGYTHINYKDEQNAPCAPLIAQLCKHHPQFYTCLNQYLDDPNNTDAYNFMVSLWHDLSFYSDMQLLKDKLRSKDASLTEEAVDALCSIDVPEGYASLSQKAIKHILPFLQRGYIYSTAVKYAGYKNALGPAWNTIEPHNQRQTLDETIHWIEKTESPTFERQHYTYTRDTFIKKLYHHSDISAQKSHTRPEAIRKHVIDKITNPIVKKSLYQLLSLAGALKQQYGSFDTIRVELARDVANGKSARQAMYSTNLNNQKENEKAEEELIRHKQRITRDNIDKVKLFAELKDKICPYTGRSIGFTQLFNEEVEIEHIYPRDRSLDNSFANKTLCYADFNRAKSGATPYEFWERDKNARGLWGKDITSWESFETRIFSLFSNQKKIHRILQKNPKLDEFASRQLNDTRYISKMAQSVLLPFSKESKTIAVNRGQQTTTLKRYWGVADLLNPRINTSDIADPDLSTRINNGEAVECIADVSKKGQVPVFSAIIPRETETPRLTHQESLINIGYQTEIKQADSDDKTQVLKIGNNTYNEWSHAPISTKEGTEESTKDENTASATKGQLWVELPFTHEAYTGEGIKLTKAYADRPKVAQHYTLLTSITISKNGNITPITQKQDIDTWLKRVLKDNKNIQGDGDYYLVASIKKVDLRRKKEKNTKNNIIRWGTFELKDSVPYFCTKGFEYPLSHKTKDEFASGEKVYLIITPDAITQVVKARFPSPSNHNTSYTRLVKIDKGTYSMLGKTFSVAQDAIEHVQDKTWYWAELAMSAPPIIHSPRYKPVAKKQIIGMLMMRGGEYMFAPQTKNRATHLHHALDAVIVACTDTKVLKELGKVYKERDERKQSKAYKEFDLPWGSFRKDVSTLLNSITVSHQKTLRALTKGRHTMSARLKLHQETAYGKHGDLYHTRKPITWVWEQEKRKKNIADPGLLSRIQRKGGAFYTTTRNNIDIPVRTLRVKEPKSNVVPIVRYNKYYDSGGNHHMIVWEGKKDMPVVTNYEIVRRKRQNEALYQPSPYLYVFEQNDMYLINTNYDDVKSYITRMHALVHEGPIDQLSAHIYRVETISDHDIFFKHHTSASSTNTASDDFIRVKSIGELQKRHPIKIQVNLLGKITIAD